MTAAYKLQEQLYKYRLLLERFDTVNRDIMMVRFESPVALKRPTNTAFWHLHKRYSVYYATFEAFNRVRPKYGRFLMHVTMYVDHPDAHNTSS